MKVLFLASIAATLDQFVAPLARSLREEGVDVLGCSGGRCDPTAFTRTYSLPPYRRAGPLALREAYRRLTSIIQQETPTLLHLHTPPALLIGRLAARHTGVPAIAVVHGTFLEPISWRSGAFAAIEAPLAHLAQQTVVLNADDYRSYARVVPGHRLALAPVGGIGIDVDRLCRARVAPLRVAAAPAIVTVGRLTGEKNLSQIVAAFRLVRRVEPNATLTFVGAPAAGERPWHAPSGPGISVHPWIDDVYPVLAGADVLVSASRREGFPMGVAEALAIGTPVVAVENRGTRELRRVGAPGLTVVDDDDTMIADAVVRGIRSERHDGSTLQQRWSRQTAVDFHKRVIWQLLRDASS